MRGSLVLRADGVEHPELVAALAAVLTAYAGVPHDGGQDAAAAPAAGMSIPF